MPNVDNNSEFQQNQNQNLNQDKIKTSILKNRKSKMLKELYKNTDHIEPQKNFKKVFQDLEFKIKNNILNIFDLKHIDTSNIHSQEDIEKSYKASKSDF